MPGPRAFLPLALLCAPAAQATEAEPAEIVIHHESIIAEEAAFDTGPLPSGSPITIQFLLSATQHAVVDMEALAHLSWPEVLTLGWEGVPGSGALETWAELTAVTTVAIDFFGYTGDWELDRRGVDVMALGTFDPLLLPGGTPNEVTVGNSGDASTAIDLSWEPFTGVSIGALVNLTPTLETTLSGFAIEQDDESVIDQEGETVLYDVPDDGLLEVVSTYLAAWSTSLDLVITPTLQVCVDILGCYEVAAFEIPVTMFTNTEVDPFEPVEYSFELPYFVPPPSTYSFGEVEVGDSVTWELELENQGHLELDGEAGIFGDEPFSVWPHEILTDAPGTDGLVVTFAPQSPGDYSAVLTITSNDPLNPLYEIAITGTGFEVLEVEEDTAVIQEKVGGCDCSVTSPRSAWASLALLSALALLCQRRRRGSSPV